MRGDFAELCLFIMILLGGLALGFLVASCSHVERPLPAHVVAPGI